MKYLKLTIYSLAFIIAGFYFASQVSAATEFTATVMQSGGDYSTAAPAGKGDLTNTKI